MELISICIHNNTIFLVFWVLRKFRPPLSQKRRNEENNQVNDLLSTLDFYRKLGSAFCLVFDVDIAIAIASLRTYHVRWRNENKDLAGPSWHSIARHLSKQGTI